MAKDKTDMLLRKWEEKLQLNQNLITMKVKDARVVYRNEDFYATINITQNLIVIIPQDNDRDVTTFTESRLNGARGLASSDNPFSTTIILNPKLPNKPICEITFKTPKQRDRALTAISVLMSTSTTEESSEEEDIAAN